MAEYLMETSIQWIFVAGGICNYGDHRRPRPVADLWWTRTPITWAQAGQRLVLEDMLKPCTELSFQEASELARRLGGRLPTAVEWEWAAGGAEQRLYPWGSQPWESGLANLRASDIGRVTVVDTHGRGATPDGLLDLAGNVWEWTSTRVPHDGVLIKGGSYNSSALHALTKFLNAAPTELKSCGIGVRLVRDK